MNNRQHDNKAEFFEFVKKIWLPIAGFLGAVTLIYNFYKMWLGDQATVTYLTTGVGLVLLIIALAWVGFKTKVVEVEPIIQSVRPSENKKTIIQPAYSPGYQKTARGVLSLLLISILLSGYALHLRRQAERADQQLLAFQHAQATQTHAMQNAQTVKQATQTQQAKTIQFAQATQQAIQTQHAQATQNAQATAQAQQELENKLIVVIATFDGPEEIYGLRNEILEQLNPIFSQDEEIEIFTVSDVITPDRGSLYARDLGEQLFADLVIWGWYRPTENPNITIHIENLSPTQIDTIKENETLEPPATLAQLESFEIQRQLGSQTSTLISFLIGTLNYETNDYQDAIDQFEKVNLEKDISTFIDPFDLFFNLGYSYRKLGDFAGAILNYDRAIELDPDRPAAYNNRGVAYKNLKQYERAIQDYTTAIELDPEYALAYNNRGIAYRNLKQYERAIQDFDKAIELDPGYASAYNSRGLAHYDRGQYKRAIQDYDEAIKLNPEYASAHNNRGNAYQHLEQYERALQDYDTAIELDAEYAAAYNNRGIAYKNLKQYERAIQDYDTAIRLDPEDALAYNNRGYVYRSLEQYERAIQDYDTAIRLDPEDALAYYARGLVYQNLEQYERAIQDFDTAIELDPEDASVYNNRGNAYRNLEQYERAIQDYDEAIRLDSEYAAAYYNRGLAYYDRGQYERAIRDYDTAIRLDPEDAAAYNNRGLAYYERGQYECAVQDYDEAIRLNPEDALAYYNRGNAYSVLEEYERAIQDYDKAIAIAPQYTWAYLDRGDAYYQLDNYAQAIKEYEKALRLEPDNPDVLNNMAYAMALMDIDLRRALEYINKSLDLVPDDLYFLDTQGYIYYRMGEYEKALDVFNHVIENGFTYSYFGRGLVYEAMGETEKAISDLKTFLAQYPDDSQSETARQHLNSLEGSPDNP